MLSMQNDGFYCDSSIPYIFCLSNIMVATPPKMYPLLSDFEVKHGGVWLGHRLEKVLHMTF